MTETDHTMVAAIREREEAVMDEQQVRALIAFTDGVMVTFRNYYAQAITRAAVEEKLAEWLKLRESLLSTTTPQVAEGQKCWHGHEARVVGCVSCVLVFDRPGMWEDR